MGSVETRFPVTAARIGADARTTACRTARVTPCALQRLGPGVGAAAAVAAAASYRQIRFVNPGLLVAGLGAVWRRRRRARGGIGWGLERGVKEGGWLFGWKDERGGRVASEQTRTNERETKYDHHDGVEGQEMDERDGPATVWFSVNGERQGGGTWSEGRRNESTPGLRSKKEGSRRAASLRILQNNLSLGRMLNRESRGHLLTLIHRRTLMKRMYPSQPTAVTHMMRSIGMLVATSHANHPITYLPHHS